MTTTKHDHLRGSQFGIDDPHTLADIQGNILVGYRARFVRHLVVRVRNPLSARAFIEAVVSGRDDVPQLTTAERWYAKPSTCLNVAVTYTGLQALGLDDRSLQTFPLAFHQGAAARAHKVGDVGDSAPDGWRDGLGDPDAAHLMWTIHAFADRADIESLALRLESMWILTQAFSITSRFDGATFDTYPGHEIGRAHV